MRNIETAFTAAAASMLDDAGKTVLYAGKTVL